MHAVPCSRARAWTIVVPVPMILCILEVATDFTSYASINRQRNRAANRVPRAGLRLGGQSLGLGLQTVKWIDLQTARPYGCLTDTIEFTGVPSFLRVFLGVVSAFATGYAIPLLVCWPNLPYCLDNRAY
jgi:hypothetical protein